MPGESYLSPARGSIGLRSLATTDRVRTAGMAYLREPVLVVLTLLQLCRAHILDTLPESWYSANVISDGFQPQPISEIFSTEATFSSTNPIIVLPKSGFDSDEIRILSTLTPPSMLSSIDPAPGRNTKVLPLTASTLSMPVPSELPEPQTQSPQIATQTQTVEPQQTTKSEPMQPEVLPIQPVVQPIVQPVQPEVLPIQPVFQPIVQPVQPEVLPIQPVVQPVVQSVQPEVLPIQPVVQPIVQPVQPKVLPIQPGMQEIQPVVQPIVQSVQPDAQNQTQSRTSQSQSQLIRLELVPQNPFMASLSNQPNPQPQQPLTQPKNPPSSPVTPQSNYFLIYQQAPQSIQSFQPPQQPSTAEVLQVPAQSITSQPVPTLVARPVPTLSVQSVPSTPPQTSTAPPTVIYQTVSTPTTTLRSAGTSPNWRNPSRPRALVQSTSSTPRPFQPVPIGAFPLKIRIVAPSGSITNVKINPTSTTKKPTTTRTRKPKKKNYQVCVDSCQGRREPICGAPLSTGIIDSNSLKGFPSVCHMACHNSFRKEIYEKLVDGRCGRLRTRIKTADSNKKLKRQELIKTEYIVDSTGPQTVIDLSGPI